MILGSYCQYGILEVMKRRTPLYKNLLIGMFLALFLISDPVFSQTVITPTAGTSVSGGPDINITTTNIYNNFAVNTFSQFRADADTNSVNFILPDPGTQVNFLLNRVNDPAGALLNTTINGILQSTAQVGGTMLFASPAGIVIGNNANINVGSLILSTSNIIECQAINGFNMDIMQDTALGISGGIDSTLPIIFTKSSTSGSITNAGIINANGVGTFAGARANVTIDTLEFTNQPTGEIRIRDGLTLVDVPGGVVNIAVNGIMDYQVSGAFVNNTQEINFFPILVNAGQLSNAGLIEAREGYVNLSSSVSEFSSGKVAIVRNESTGVITTDALNFDASGGVIRLFTEDDPVFANRTGNMIVQNDGLISARSSLTDTLMPGQGRVELRSDNLLNEQPTSHIDVRGLIPAQKAGEISLMPSFVGLNQDMQVGFDPPVGDSVHISNTFFTHIDTEIPTDFVINQSQVFIQSNNDLTISNLNVPEGLDINVMTPNNLLVQSQITTGSPLNLSANNQISIMANIIASFDDTPNIHKFLRFQSPTINLDLAGNSDIILQSQNGNFPIIMRADIINNLNVPGNEIINRDIGTSAGGQFVYQPETPTHSMELNGNSIIVRTNLGLLVSTVDLNNFNLGNDSAGLALGDPLDLVTSPYTGRINVTAIPLLPSLYNGSFLFSTMNSTPLVTPVAISNCDFQINAQDVVIITPAAALNSDIDLTVNNNFDVLSLFTPQAVDIIDQANGIDVRSSTKTGYPNNVSVNTLNLSTPVSYNGSVSIEGDFNQLSVSNMGTGLVTITELGSNIDINNMQAANGDVNIQAQAGLLIPSTSTITANNIYLFNTGFAVGDIIIDGDLNANDFQIVIEQRDLNSSLSLSNTSTLQVSPLAGPGRIDLFSEGTMALDGALNIIGRSNLPGQLSEIHIESPQLTFSSISPPDIQVTEQFEPYLPLISLRTDAIINGDIPHVGANISAWNVESMQHGSLMVDSFTDGDISVNPAGIDIHGGGQDLLFSNVYLGDSEGFLGVGNFGVLLPGPPPPITYGRILVTGKPVNLSGSFDNATFAFNSQLISSLIDPIEIQNSNFSNCNLFLNVPNATGLAGIEATNNNNFSNLTIMTEGTADITDLVNGLTIDYIEFNGGHFESRASNLNVLSNGDLIARGDFDNANLHAQITGNIVLEDYLNGINIEQCLSENNNVSISSSNLINILPAAIVEGGIVHIENIIDKITGIPAGIITIEGTILARNGNVGIDTSFGSVVFGSTSNVQARQILLPDSGNILVNRINSSGTLNIDFQDGFTMSTTSLPLSDAGYLEIGDNLLATTINVTGAQAGELSARSPYTAGTTIPTPSGNINTKLIIIMDGETPTPPPPPPVPDPDPVPVPNPVPTPDEEFTPEDSTPEIGDSIGDIILVNNETGEIISLTYSPDTDNVIQQDLTDNTVLSDDYLNIEGETTLTDGTSFADGEGLPENDTISFTTDTEDSTQTNDDNTTSTTDSTDTDTNRSNQNDNKISTKNSGTPLLNIMGNDGPLDIGDQRSMTSLFNMCKGAGSCGDIDTPINNVLLDQSIFLNAKENEYLADQHGTLFLSRAGYHPSGLRGFLMTLDMIEKNTDNMHSKIGENATPVFSYRHPKTEKRIEKIKEEVANNHLMESKTRNVRKKAYNDIIKGIN